MKYLLTCTLILQSFLLGCSGGGGFLGNYDARDYTEHFWKYVDGTYHSSKNGYYVNFNKKEKTIQWYMPMKVGDKARGEICYLEVEGSIESVGTEFPAFIAGDNDPDSLMAKGRVDGMAVIYMDNDDVLRDEDRDSCEAIADYNRPDIYIEPLYLPVVAFGPGVVQLDLPAVCFLGCHKMEPRKNKDDFMNKAAGVYTRAKLPFTPAE